MRGAARGIGRGPDAARVAAGGDRRGGRRARCRPRGRPETPGGHRRGARGARRSRGAPRRPRCAARRRGRPARRRRRRGFRAPARRRRGRGPGQTPPLPRRGTGYWRQRLESAASQLERLAAREAEAREALADADARPRALAEQRAGSWRRPRRRGGAPRGGRRPRPRRNGTRRTVAGIQGSPGLARRGARGTGAHGGSGIPGRAAQVRHLPEHGGDAGMHARRSRVDRGGVRGPGPAPPEAVEGRLESCSANARTWVR